MGAWITAGDVREIVRELVRSVPVLVVVVAILVAGKRGVWYWGPAVRRVIANLEADRDAWRDLAHALLREHGLVHAPTATSSRPPGAEGNDTA